ncbi:hypothetical protein B566_EDAN011292 [Ephemera danica]|nr:hypothetical protein B566_EDAN011292 [Ephemera danica]
MFVFADDPYYCGLRARIPNFAKSKSGKEERRYPAPPQTSMAPLSHHHHHHQLHSMGGYVGQQPAGPTAWRGGYHDPALDADSMESPYNHIYGRLPVPTRAFIPPTPRTMYIGEWD